MEQRLDSGFYGADSTLFPDGKFHLCKMCVENIITQNGFHGFLMVLRSMNKPFLQDIWKEDYKKYLTQINSLPQYKGLTYDHSIFENKDNDVFIKDSDSDLSYDLKKFWRGYSDEDISTLDEYYQELIHGYDHSSPAQRRIYKNIAVTQYRADKAKSNAEYDRLMGTLSKLMNDANIKPVQETGTDSLGLSTFGEWIKKIEEEEPIPEPQDEFNDPDGIMKYIDKWFVSHFAKIFGLKSVNEDEQLEDFVGDR
ncbi:hypothetical protein [Brevibacillus laterosporus]|uniref:hypothetical protein n=1 Tax=Brevibacillus laterosporus TaxID=1465 RepID=UPI000E6CE438|nr:hypothetical protein [Brevibacillus laterosporus]AYB37538.1 hypothetical protein D5F52_04170 [Brevibacillus laterosporus]MBM7110966.1 hypothetical protein [Brevibacillus laterosporus]